MDGIKFEGRTINVKLKKSRKDVRRRRIGIDREPDIQTKVKTKRKQRYMEE